MIAGSIRVMYRVLGVLINKDLTVIVGVDSCGLTLHLFKEDTKYPGVYINMIMCDVNKLKSRWALECLVSLLNAVVAMSL